MATQGGMNPVQREAWNLKPGVKAILLIAEDEDHTGVYFSEPMKPQEMEQLLFNGVHIIMRQVAEAYFGRPE